jgi:hypothetical protein
MSGYCQGFYPIDQRSSLMLTRVSVPDPSPSQPGFSGCWDQKPGFCNKCSPLTQINERNPGSLAVGATGITQILRIYGKCRGDSGIASTFFVKC